MQDNDNILALVLFTAYLLTRGLEKKTANLTAVDTSELNLKTMQKCTKGEACTREMFYFRVSRGDDSVCVTSPCDSVAACVY